MAELLEPVRIAYFSNFSPKKLGTGENRLVLFARRAADRGHSFTLFGRRPVHPDVAEALGAAGATWRPLEEIEARPLRASRELARDFDVIQLNMIAPRSRAALAAYLALPARILFVDRVSGPPGERPDERRLWPMRVLDRLTLIRVHQVAGITEYVRTRAQLRFGISERRSCTIYNGVDLDRFRPSDDLLHEGGPLRILAVASLIPEKGLDVLLRAVASMRHAEWTLRVVGEGPERARLEAWARDLGLEGRVDFLGLRDDVPELLRTSAVFVHPAVWQEALGNTVLEAMASGVCTLASRVGGIPELLDDGAEGVLLPAGDPGALAEALDSLAADPVRRRSLGEAARRRAERDFGLEESIGRHLDWCEHAARRGLWSVATR